MSLKKTDTIDLATILPGDEKVTLVVFDEGEISNEEDRRAALQEKLVTYLEFILSGQFARTFPEYLAMDIRIMVVCTTSPSDQIKSIEGIRDHSHSETFIPVEVILREEFLSISK